MVTLGPGAPAKTCNPPSASITFSSPTRTNDLSMCDKGNMAHLSPATASPEGRLVEAAQLARVQRVASRAQKVKSLEADIQMLCDGALVKGIGGAGQLDLAVQRLVGHAQQGPIGDPQPKALRGDGAALHVDGDGARQVDSLPLLREAQLPIAIVVGDDRAGAQQALQRLTPRTRDNCRSVLQ